MMKWFEKAKFGLARDGTSMIVKIQFETIEEAITTFDAWINQEACCTCCVDICYRPMSNLGESDELA